MIFNVNQLNKMENYIEHMDNLFAHIDYDDEQKIHLRELETLEEHSILTFNYFIQIVEKKGLSIVFKNIINNLDLTKDERQTCFSLISNAIYMHDTGKSNPNFQSKLRVNHNQSQYKRTYDGFKEAYPDNSNHSLLSSLIFINEYKNIKNPLLKNIVYGLAYVQSKHHGRISDLTQLHEKIKVLFNEMKYEDVLSQNCILKNYKHFNEIEANLDVNFLESGIYLNNQDNNLFLLFKLVFVLMTAADSLATYHYSNQLDSMIEDFGVLNQDEWKEFFNDYEESIIYKGIQNFKNDNNYFGKNNINTLRSEIFLESQDTLREFLKDDSKNIFYLEAPTGSGKTNTSINLIKTITENCSNINKAFYIFPFNTLVEQTYNALINDFKLDKNKVRIVNSVTPITEYGTGDSDTNNINCDLSLLNHQFINSPITLTSHVNFFTYLFGTGRVESFPFFQLANSVIVLDEIQTYNIKLWKEIIYIFNKFSKVMNFKVIIMSATLPKLSDLISENVNVLIKDTRVYYENDLFKKRVVIDYSFLDNDFTYDYENDEDIDLLGRDISLKINQNLTDKPKKVLIEMITKKSCRKLFKYMRRNYNDENFIVYEISGMDNKFKRKFMLDKIKNEAEKNIIVVCTQVIEAGVDIDMDIGFKNVSMLENEEQFLGRLNRSCKRSAIAYFFNYYPAKKIYKNDYRVKYNDKNINNPQYRQYLDDKIFTEHYNFVFSEIQRIAEQYNDSCETNFDQFIKQFNNCCFDEIKSHMRLISSQTYELFLPLSFKLNEINLNTDSVLFKNYKKLCDPNAKNLISGYMVWEKYKECIFNKTLSFAEKQIMLSQFNELLINFTVGVNIDPSSAFKCKKCKIGSMFYVKKDDIQNFIDEDGLIDPEKIAKYIKTKNEEEECESAQNLFI